MVDEKKPGPPGAFPLGLISEDDEGNIQIGVGVSDTGEVVLQFWKLVKWLGFTPEDARALAESLVKNADLAQAQIEKIKH